MPDENLPNAEQPEGHDAEHGPAHPEIRYERRDASLFPVIAVAVASCLIGLFLYWAIYYFFRTETDRLAVRRASEFPLAEHVGEKLPEEPRLEPIDRMARIQSPNVYLRELEKEETLHSLGPTAEDNYAHVSIDRAIQALAGHLPVRSQHPPHPRKDLGLLDAGESNSGRMFRGKLP